MANIPNYTEYDFIRDDKNIDYSMIFNMPFIERIIFQYALRDICLKETIEYETKREGSNIFGKKHPKESLNEARNLLKKFHDNIRYEPLCNKAFNDARECLFRSTMKLRVCKAELDMFEECYNNPINFAKFEEVATDTQKETKHYFINIKKRDASL